MIMTDDAARQTLHECVCAKCWGRLDAKITQLGDSKKNIPQLVDVTCQVCGDGAGFHTKFYAAKRTRESLIQRQQAERALKPFCRFLNADGLLPSERPQKSIDDINALLGFV